MPIVEQLFIYAFCARSAGGQLGDRVHWRMKNKFQRARRLVAVAALVVVVLNCLLK